MPMVRLTSITPIIFLFIITVSVGFTHASDATSTHFILRDAVVGTGGQMQSSASFQLFSSGNQNASGRDGSSASFSGRFGFLYYPYIQSGTLTAVLNGAAIDLSWSASAATLGLQVSGYDVGISSTSGSGYSYTSVGNVTSYSYTGLTPGTYYFIIRTLDGLGNPIAVSNEEMVVLPQIISFSLSDTTVGFGPLSPSSVRYATGDTLGSSTETEAHQIVAATNAPYGYSIFVAGGAPSDGVHTIPAIGGTNTSPSAGTAQFGVRLVAAGGSASVASPYSAGGFAYDATATTPSSIATNAVGDAISTTFSVRYAASVSSTTPSGAYDANLTYVITPNF